MSHRRWVRRLVRNAPVRGPWHSELLAGVALSYQQCCYVEVGVEHGVTLNVLTPLCAHVHCCDLADCSSVVPAGARFWHMSSDEFFSSYDGPPPQLVFIDGDHSYEQAARDYRNALAILAPGGTIALHDTSPAQPDDTSPERCGDVWRLLGEIELPHLTFTAFPGLTLVRP